MADILIRGMEMPIQDALLHIYANGKAVCYPFGIDGEVTEFEAVELPEHGDLIDAESLSDDLLYDAELADRALSDMSLVGPERDYMQSEKDVKQNCAYYVSHAPVVIPSNKEV